MAPRWVKQAAYGETRTAIIKKKLMKNKLKIEAAAPANASQLSSFKAVKQTGFVRHCANRGLSTEKVLNCLRTQLPSQYELAEVVGKWVWLDVSPAQHKAIAARLRHGQDLGNSRERGQLSFIPLIFRYISFRSRALQSQNCPPSLTRPILA